MSTTWGKAHFATTLSMGIICNIYNIVTITNIESVKLSRESSMEITVHNFKIYLNIYIDIFRLNSEEKGYTSLIKERHISKVYIIYMMPWLFENNIFM